MKKILVATYFSTRSDRAIRRATLLAKKFGSAVSLIHVVDDDRPRRIVDAEPRLGRDASERASAIGARDQWCGLQC